MSHREQVLQGDIDILSGLRVCAKLDSRGHDNGAIVVGSTGTLASLPLQLATVGDDACSHCATIVASPADHHEANLADFTFGLEIILRLLGRSAVFSVFERNICRAVGVFAGDVRVGVADIRGLNSESAAGFVPEFVDAHASRVTVAVICVWCHDIKIYSSTLSV